MGERELAMDMVEKERMFEFYNERMMEFGERMTKIEKKQKLKRTAANTNSYQSSSHQNPSLTNPSKKPTTTSKKPRNTNRFR